MAKGKAVKCAWYCSECKSANYVSMYNKRRDSEIPKERERHCSQCRKHVTHKRKDVKKAAQ